MWSKTGLTTAQKTIHNKNLPSWVKTTFSMIFNKGNLKWVCKYLIQNLVCTFSRGAWWFQFSVQKVPDRSEQFTIWGISSAKLHCCLRCITISPRALWSTVCKVDILISVLFGGSNGLASLHWSELFRANLILFILLYTKTICVKSQLRNELEMSHNSEIYYTFHW